MASMTSLEPMVRLLIRVLSARDPAGIHRPIAIHELMDAVLPYRLVRRELGVDSAEDYETLLLRLCAGEGSFVQTDSDTQAALLAELKKPMADLALLRVYGDAQVVLRNDPMLTAMEARPEERYAPPSEAPTPAVEDPSDTEDEPPADQTDAWVPDPVFEANASAVTPQAPDFSGIPPASLDRAEARCPFCGGLLPGRMTINFCPHCGMGQEVGSCRACGADMDAGWRYCVSCGEDAQGGLT